VIKVRSALQYLKKDKFFQRRLVTHAVSGAYAALASNNVGFPKFAGISFSLLPLLPSVKKIEGGESRQNMLNIFFYAKLIQRRFHLKRLSGVISHVLASHH
jgi:hypothetical protein